MAADTTQTRVADTIKDSEEAKDTEAIDDEDVLESDLMGELFDRDME